MQLTQKEADDLISLMKIPKDIGGGIDFDHQKKVVTLLSPDDREEFFLNVTPSKYELKKITPVDQFPNTVHVETCVLLQRKNM